MAPGPGPDQAAPFSDFCRYLGGKQRAGVVPLPPAPGVGPRTLYLLPPSEGVARQLGVPYEARDLMLALVVPAAQQA